MIFNFHASSLLSSEPWLELPFKSCFTTKALKWKNISRNLSRNSTKNVARDYFQIAGVTKRYPVTAKDIERRVQKKHGYTFSKASATSYNLQNCKTNCTRHFPDSATALWLSITCLQRTSSNIWKTSLARLYPQAMIRKTHTVAWIQLSLKHNAIRGSCPCEKQKIVLINFQLRQDFVAAIFLQQRYCMSLLLLAKYDLKSSLAQIKVTIVQNC